MVLNPNNPESSANADDSAPKKALSRHHGVDSAIVPGSSAVVRMADRRGELYFRDLEFQDKLAICNRYHDFWRREIVLAEKPFLEAVFFLLVYEDGGIVFWGSRFFAVLFSAIFAVLGLLADVAILPILHHYWKRFNPITPDFVTILASISFIFFLVAGLQLVSVARYVHDKFDELVEAVDPDSQKEVSGEQRA